MNTKTKNTPPEHYLTCEHSSTFLLLMMSAGMMGAFTFVLRGGVFCNAQTANFVMMAAAFGQGQWEKGLYFLIPIAAYLSGAFISEALPSPIKRFGCLRWDTYLVGFEILVLFGIGWLPLSVPDQVVQVTINFIASMQYNTFRQSEGIPMATTFCTNHLRQTGIGLATFFRKHDGEGLQKSLKHIRMLLVFCIGGVIVTVLIRFAGEKAIWAATLPMLVAFVMMVHADLTTEHDELNVKPHGH
ncbi:MAG: YoaK family protein [Candidatus Ornithomonoglobus sp.]